MLQDFKSNLDHFGRLCIKSVDNFLRFQRSQNIQWFNNFQFSNLPPVKIKKEEFIQCRRRNLLFKLTHYCPVFPFYTPWKTSENRRFSDVFRGYKKETTSSNGLEGKGILLELLNFLLNFYLSGSKLIRCHQLSLFLLHVFSH